jgi:3-oxoadipate enol-lactonase
MPLTIDLAGERFNVRLDGPENAPVVVLSNSLGTNLSMWEPQMAALTRRFRVLRYDTRGHGATIVRPGDYGIETLGGDVLRLLDALSITRFSFCGISMGGATAMWLALHAPERIQRVVLASAATKFGTPERWNARIEAVTKGGMSAIADGVIEIWFTAEFRAREPAAVARVREMLLASPVEGYLAACRAVRSIDLTAEVARIDCPALVMSGTRDTSTPPAQGRATAEAIRGARFVELPAAHISNVEVAQAFNAELLGFLTTESS